MSALDIEPVKRVPERRYTNEDRDKALMALVLLGSSQAAEDEVGVPRRTISDWRRRYAQRFYELSELHRASAEKAIIAKFREAGHKAADAIHEAIDLEHERIKTGEVKDAAASARNLATAAGISVDKMLVLDGRPTEITKDATVEQLLDKYRKDRPSMVIDGTAVEIEAEHASGPASPPDLATYRELPVQRASTVLPGTEPT